jgi:hypothetical protein
MEQLLLINPKRRRKRAKNSRRRRHSARRRHANPYREHRRHRNPRRRHRNPLSMSGIKPELTGAAVGAAGAVAIDIIMGYLTPYIPASLTSNQYLTLATKIAAALGIGMLAGKVIGGDKARGATLGALTVVGYDFIKTLVPASLPMAGLSGVGAYMHSNIPGSLNGYNPGSYVRNSSTAVPGIANNPVQFGAYMPHGNMAGVMGDEMF